MNPTIEAALKSMNLVDGEDTVHRHLIELGWKLAEEAMERRPAIGWQSVDGALHKGCPPMSEPAGWQPVYAAPQPAAPEAPQSDFWTNLEAAGPLEPAPIDMVLHCTACGMQHIDEPSNTCVHDACPRAEFCGPGECQETWD